MTLIPSRNSLIPILLFSALVFGKEATHTSFPKEPHGELTIRAQDIEESNPAYWARKAYATIYQSCAVLSMEADRHTSVEEVVTKDEAGNRVLIGEKSRKEFIEKHFILKQLKGKPLAPGCVSVFKTPPMYILSSKPSMSGNEIDLQADKSPLADGVLPKYSSLKGCDTKPRLSKGSSSVSGIDCSGFIATAFARGGMKFKKGQKHPELGICSRWIHRIQGDADSCLLNVELSEKDGSGLKTGDIINSAGHHVVFVDRVGPDPFGVQRAIDQNLDCDKITINDLDISILHSSGIGSWGVYRAHINIYSLTKSPHGEGRLIGRQLVKLAQGLCYRAKSGQTGKMASPNFNEKYPLTILRHNSEDSACRFDPENRIQLKNESCVDACF